MAATTSVTDFLSNLHDQLVNSARLMIRAPQRQSIFEAIYHGQKQEKTVQEIMMITGLSQIRVLNEGKKLGPLVEKVRGGFRKKKELAPHYKKILSLARNRKKLEKVPTKVRPASRTDSLRITVNYPKSEAGKATHITIEDINSFSRAKTTPSNIGIIAEEKIKAGFQKVIGERGTFKDWGGERSDLFSSKLRVNGRRRATAIAFKGKGTKGKLVPKKMGANGDQVNRLFDEPAEVFLIVYCGQIDSSVVSQMEAFAVAKKAIHGRQVYFGVIDADDLGRIAAGYPRIFV